MPLHRVANVDGMITPLEEARIPVLDRGFLYGDSVYEVFRTYSGVPLFYDEHMDRLENSARLIYLRMTQSRQELSDQIRRTVQASGANVGQDVYVRYHVTRGSGPVDLYPDPNLTSRFVILVKELPAGRPEFYSRGIRLAVPHVRRNPTDALNPNIKSGNYLNNILAMHEAVRLGADDCLILNHADSVTESSTSNVFFVIDGSLLTPSQASGNLRGITKSAILHVCRGNDLSVDEADITVTDMARATECFITSATREVMPVYSLLLPEGQTIEFPAGGGPVTCRVSRWYEESIRRYVEAHAALRLIRDTD